MRGATLGAAARRTLGSALERGRRQRRAALVAQERRGCRLGLRARRVPRPARPAAAPALLVARRPRALGDAERRSGARARRPDERDAAAVDGASATGGDAA